MAQWHGGMVAWWHGGEKSYCTNQRYGWKASRRSLGLLRALRERLEAWILQQAGLKSYALSSLYALPIVQVAKYRRFVSLLD